PRLLLHRILQRVAVNVPVRAHPALGLDHFNRIGRSGQDLCHEVVGVERNRRDQIFQFRLAELWRRGLRRLLGGPRWRQLRSRRRLVLCHCWKGCKHECAAGDNGTRSSQHFRQALHCSPLPCDESDKSDVSDKNRITISRGQCVADESSSRDSFLTPVQKRKALSFDKDPAHPPVCVKSAVTSRPIGRPFGDGERGLSSQSVDGGQEARSAPYIDCLGQYRLHVTGQRSSRPTPYKPLSAYLLF